MLTRATSDAGTRLRRSKSTSTVHTNRVPAAPEPLDLDVAQHHAIAAATAAFARAQAAEAAGNSKTRSIELTRGKSNGSHKSQPQREPSMRASMRPPKAAPVAANARKSWAPTTKTDKMPPFQVTPGTGRTMSAQPSVLSNENMRPSSQPKAQRPSAAASMASQQIRKARSMYYASSIQTGSPLPRPPAKYLSTPPPVSPHPDSSLLSARSAEGSLLSARSADGYLERPRSSVISPLAPPRPPVTVVPNEQVDKARDKCLQDFQQQRQVKHKPSLFLAPFKKRQEKLKKKAPSSSAGVSVASHTSGEPGPGVQTDHKPLKEKRSISDSLRNKFKKVFRKGSHKTTTLPVQQTDASRHYFTGHRAEVGPHSELPVHLDVPSPDEYTLQRVRSRSPSFEGGNAALARPSSRGSNRSLHSEVSFGNTTASRVTSWSNSSVCDISLTQRAIKRLTVIHEAKDSMGSEADHHFMRASPRRKPPPLPGFAAFRDPMPMDSLLESTSTPVDPKRVFSALMKEMGPSQSQNVHSVTTHRTPDSDVFVSSGTRGLHSSASRHARANSASSDRQRPASSQRPDTAQSKTGSVKSSSFKSFGRALKATIRSVTPSELPPPPSPVPDRVTSVRGAVRIPRPTSAGSSISAISEGVDNQGEGNILNSVNFKLRPRVRSPNLQNKDAITPTQDEVETQPQKVHNRWRTPVLENGLCVPDATETSTPPQQLDPEGLPHSSARNLLRSPKPRQVFSPLSPSIYSRNTDGASIYPNDSVMSLDATAGDIGDHGSGPGSAVIITSQSVKSYVIGTPTPQRVTGSARSSRDWKAWLSHEVSELGNLSTEDISIQYSTPPAPKTHRRELTQISDEGETVLVHELEGSSPPELPLGVIETPPFQDILVEPETAFKASSESLPPPEPSVEYPKALKISPRRQPSPLLNEQRLSSMSSGKSSQPSITRPRLKQSMSSSSARMNDRFPFINKGRSSSSNSAKMSRHTPSLAGSHSSSSKATPSPRLYSDFSAPGSAPSSIKASKIEETATSNRPAVPANQNHKENITPMHPTAMQTVLGFPGSPSTHSLDRPKSMQALQPLTASSTTWNRASSSLAQYTTSAEDNTKISSPGPGRTVQTPPRGTSGKSGNSPSPRIRLRVRPTSPGKLTMRPKSAFDLRNANRGFGSPTTTLTPSPLVMMGDGSGSPTKRPSAALSKHTLDGDALRLALESQSPWRNSKGAGTRSTPFDPTRRLLHAAHSSSTLALNKEPSPGSETRIIDDVLGDDFYERSAVGSSRGGSVTPGQRMADRFLRERNAGSGAGSPVLAAREMERGREASSGAGTPAFL